MPLRRLLLRSLLPVGAVAGLGAAFVAGTSYGGPGADGTHRWPDAHAPARVDASPVAYAGSGLQVQDSCDDLLAWYVERGVDLVGPYGWLSTSQVYAFADDAGGVVPQAHAASGAVRAPSALAPSPVRTTNGETGTNVQEAGVDEPDVLKTDGRLLVRIQDGHLVTYDVSGATVERLASLDLPGAVVADSTELLLSGTTVVVTESHTTGEPVPSGSTTVVTVDVADPAHPAVTHTVKYDATLVAARLHDGVVRVVVQAGLPDLDFAHPSKLTDQAEAVRKNQQLVRETTIEDWLPSGSVDGAEPSPLLACDQVAVPDDSASLGTMAVVGFDAPAPDAPSVTGLAVDTGLAYASTDQLYLATSPSYGFGGGCWECAPPPMPEPLERGSLLPDWITGSGGPVDDGGIIDAVPCCPGYGTDPGDGTSHLYAFDLDGIDTTFAASGQVDGVIRDRWSMDAVGGVLRVAVGPNQNTGDFNSIVTFDQQGNDLVVAGRLDDLGVGEDLESVRWFDTLAIVVTFRQVDPLYAVDLTDPAAPRLIGSLKIPGYAAYLHPLGQHRLLGLGQGQDPTGQWGAQAGLFDVTDLTHPRQLDVVSYDPGSQALATADPRQLTWLPDGRTVLTVIGDHGRRGDVGYVSVLHVGDGRLTNRMVEVEYGDEVSAVRLVPVADGRVVLVTGDDASFFDL